jgi:hypothetical protein
LLGEHDNFERRQDAWKASTMDCGSHYLQYEKYRKVLHEASKEWLLQGMVAGKRQGMPSADANGRIQ